MRRANSAEGLGGNEVATRESEGVSLVPSAGSLAKAQRHSLELEMIHIQLPEALMFARTVLSTRIIDTAAATTSAFASFSNGKTGHFLFAVDIDIDTYFFFFFHLEFKVYERILDDASMECQRYWMHVGLLMGAVEPVAASRPVCGSMEKTTRLFEP